MSILYNVNFIVNLIHGEIKAVYEKKEAYSEKPIAWFNNVYQAEYCSLGIMLQNMAEDGFKREEVCDISSRIVLGSPMKCSVDYCKQERNKLREEYAQYWI